MDSIQTHAEKLVSQFLISLLKEKTDGLEKSFQDASSQSGVPVEELKNFARPHFQKAFDNLFEKK